MLESSAKKLTKHEQLAISKWDPTSSASYITMTVELKSENVFKMFVRMANPMQQWLYLLTSVIPNLERESADISIQVLEAVKGAIRVADELFEESVERGEIIAKQRAIGEVGGHNPFVSEVRCYSPAYVNWINMILTMDRDEVMRDRLMFGGAMTEGERTDAQKAMRSRAAKVANLIRELQAALMRDLRNREALRLQGVIESPEAKQARREKLVEAVRVMLGERHIVGGKSTARTPAERRRSQLRNKAAQQRKASAVRLIKPEDLAGTSLGSERVSSDGSRQVVYAEPAAATRERRGIEAAAG